MRKVEPQVQRKMLSMTKQQISWHFKIFLRDGKQKGWNESENGMINYYNFITILFRMRVP